MWRVQIEIYKKCTDWFEGKKTKFSVDNKLILREYRMIIKPYGHKEYNSEDVLDQILTLFKISKQTTERYSRFSLVC